ncbi:MAG TPA: DUF4440 domain-containing protein [Caulobacteraceae bacterium]|jgi:ketosteroid isomerase-like protein
MRTFQTKLAGLAALALVAGCHPAATPAPAADAGQIADALRANEVQWVADLAARDAAKDAAHYDDAGVLMAPGFAPVQGKAAIRTTIAQLMADPNFSLSFKPDTVGVSPGGDMAYTRGRFNETATNPATHAKEAASGNYLTVYRKEPDGSWKALEDIASPGAPAAKSN